MNKYLRLTIVPAILVGLVPILHAQEPAKPPDRGTVLLLKTGHAMEGDIEKVGEHYCVRRGKSEVRIGEDRAIRLCADWNDAYAYAQTQIKADNADHRVSLARWCHTHRLTEKALEQAQIALELQPKHVEAKQLVALLERALQETAAKPVSPAPVSAAKPVEPAPTVDVSFDTLVGFTAKVQPILMNRCATCHATGAGGKFHLERVSETGNKATTQRNLAAVLTYVDLEHPAISPLLVKAITRHGDAQTPPVRDRSEKPLQMMQQWVEQTIARNPQLKDYAKKSTPAKAQPVLSSPAGRGVGGEGSVFPMQRSATPSQAPDVVSQQVPRLEIDEKNPPRVQPIEARPTPIATTPADEFDALHFNRHFHPAYYQQQTATANPQR